MVYYKVYIFKSSYYTKSEGNLVIKDIMQIQAVLAFGAIPLYVILTHLLLLLYLRIMIKLTLVPLGVRISTGHVSQSDLRNSTPTKLQMSESRKSPNKLVLAIT